MDTAAPSTPSPCLHNCKRKLGSRYSLENLNRNDHSDDENLNEDPQDNEDYYYGDYYGDYYYEDDDHDESADPDREKRSTRPHIRTRRSTTGTTAKKGQKALKIRRTNSASTQLGLTVLLYPDEPQHSVGLNNYIGYRVSG